MSRIGFGFIDGVFFTLTMIAFVATVAAGTDLLKCAGNAEWLQPDSSFMSPTAICRIGPPLVALKEVTR